MIYYAPAIIITLAMAYLFSTEYELKNGVKIKTLRNFGIAFLVLIPLTFVAAFRWEIGSDTWYGASYTESYHAAKEGENIRDFEPLFYLFTRVIAMFDLPFFWYLFILCIFFMVCVAYGFSRGSISILWTIIVFFLLYIYFDSFSALRQGVAEGLIIIALANIVYMPASKKKDIIILALMVTGALFHSIALVYVPIYIISRIRFSRIGLLKATVIGILAYPLLQIVLNYVSKIINSGSEIDYSVNGVALINLVLSCGIFVLCWYFYDSINELDENAYIYINMSLCIFILMLNSGALQLAFRYFDMLKTAYLFTVPFIVKGVKNNRTRLFVQVVLLTVFAFWFINSFYIQANYASRYQSALSDWERISNLP